MPARRTSNRERKLKGSFRPSQPTPESPAASGELRTPPKYLSERQRFIWKQALAVAPANTLKRIDRDMLGAWVIASDRMREANRRLPTLSDADETRACRRELTEVTRLMVVLGRELGMSPAARSRITIEPLAPEKDPEAFDPWSHLKLVK